MIEPAPQLQNSNIRDAVNMIIEPANKDLFTRIDDEYLYWDKVKYMAPEGIKPEILWHAVKIRRSTNRNIIFFGKYKFHFTITGKMQAHLHEFDMKFGGNLGAGNIIPEKESNMYLISSIMEEAIASSQMEGASTTRRVAKDMLRKQLKPVNKSQQMIVNNYSTIRYLVEHKDEPFTVEALKDIHKAISSNTLDNKDDEGKFRSDNNIYVVDNITGEVAHTPPEADELHGLLSELCDFANEPPGNPFVHPIVKGIIIHFMLAYFHPFVDGNGRTARSLVYWYLLKNGYWLTEYLTISRVIYRMKTRYEKAFLYTEEDEMDLSYFINFNLNAMKKAYEELKSYLHKKIKEQDDFYTFRGFSDINERQVRIIKILKRKPAFFFTVKELTTRFEISPKTARSDLQRLVERGILEEVPVNKRKTGYVKSSRFDTILQELTSH